MRSDLRSLRERIRQVEAGGHRDTPLRREYNHKLRAHKGLKGGGGDIGIGPPEAVKVNAKFNHILKNKREPSQAETMESCPGDVHED